MGRLGVPRVLNAFRHHRGRHTRKMSDVGNDPRSAQRLSASQRSAPPAASNCSTRSSRCSTPFGITEVGTGGISGHDRARGSVLNAFRHHRGRHVAIRHGRHWVQGVLNAFRHHRGRHRRHRRRADLRSRVTCSTPFGITEVGTRGLSSARSRSPSDSAQRLSASQRSAPPGALKLMHASSVLNAFRHHRGRHRPALTPCYQIGSDDTFQACLRSLEVSVGFRTARRILHVVSILNSSGYS